MDRPNGFTTRRALLASVGTVAVGGGIVYAGSQSESGAARSESLPDSVQFHSSRESTDFGIDLSGHPIMGRMDAPLELYYWSDYQCPFCRRFERDTLPELIDDHVSSGNLRMVFIEFPYLSDGSLRAAVMDRCVWRQVREDDPGQYWQWHTAVFGAQEEKGSGWASRDNLLAITRDVNGVDAETVGTCMRSDRQGIESDISDDSSQAQQLGFRGTPAFALYNQETDTASKLVGAQPYERFKEEIASIQNT